MQEIFNHLWWSVSDIYQNLLNGFSLENNRRLNRRTHTYSHMHFVFWLLKICIKNRYILSIYQTFSFFWANHTYFVLGNFPFVFLMQYYLFNWLKQLMEIAFNYSWRNSGEIDMNFRLKEHISKYIFPQTRIRKPYIYHHCYF